MFTLHLLKQQKKLKRVIATPQCKEIDNDSAGNGNSPYPHGTLDKTTTSDFHPQNTDRHDQESAALPMTERQEHDGIGDGVEEVEEEERIGIWGFTRSEVEQFPALRKRNFWCIQRHSATAMHYDLRMQVDDGTVSWAVPKGLIGISKKGESSRLAVETTIHPISYTTYEGADGRNFSAGRKGGTLLWDIGEYTITKPSSAIDSTSDEERSVKRRRILKGDNDPEEDGKYQEDLFRQSLERRIGYGKSRSMHFILRGGRKMTNHHFILVLAASTKHTFSSSGQIKKTWFLRLPREVDGYPWDRGGEEGGHWGRSVKTGRTLKEVTEGYLKRPDRWAKEEERFKNWFGDED
uniref:DNA ligase D, 3'-phosphoesterase domain-containing protein n=1 Tax=Kwoniella bestiolae CBS 10118 TaxID=1296100 RepID=A0A1B9GF26_9TREE|nr:DNA ligase D, 3'-phosphoesterase domain-containing protein [Kwoniella bestiolae CBS 10118]OCF29647.1 DNA ligase D, 3'-phosphoesterase domain-containing protein [Kwoniella bestiolae CBS 10118]